MATQFCEGKQQQAPSRLDVMTYVQLIQMLRDYLQKERYVLVLDDVWSTNVWKFICNALPAAQEYGSRVIVTTRIGEVASYCRARSSDYIYHLEPLLREYAWSLFCKRAFQLNDENTCPLELEELSQSFVHKWRGLPLAVVTLAGLLSIKEQRYAEWEMILRSFGVELETNDNLKSMKKIIMLSYNELPYHLKSCFLYLSIFLEDHLIKRFKLIRLWIAEGFVEQKDSKRTSEEVAESYLNMLSSRSLIQVAKHKCYGKVISYQIHDLVREIIVSKFEEHFFTSAGLLNTDLSNKIRHLSIGKKSETSPNYENYSRLRSLFIFRVEAGLSNTFVISLFSRFRLLRVVDLESVSMESFPDDLTSLFYLRYLSLENMKIKNLPNSIGKLTNLETLNLKGTFICELPVEVRKLRHLRHLLIYHYVVDIYNPNLSNATGIKVPAGIGNLTSLQKLALVEATESEIVRELGNLTQLRRLGVIKLRREDGCDFCTSVEKMNHLQALDVSSMDEDELLDLHSVSQLCLKTTLQHLYLRGCLEKLPQWIASLQNLVVLHLRWSGLKDDPLKTLQSLPNLVILELSKAYDGEELCCDQARGYLRLKELWLSDLIRLKQVRVEKGAFSLLEKLFIGYCKELLEVPLWLEHLTNIKLLQLRDLPTSFLGGLYKDDGGLVDCVRHIPTIHNYDSNENKLWQLT